MQADMYEAFRAIDIPEDRALRAAEAMSRAGQLPDIRRDIGAIQTEVMALHRDVGLLKWMAGMLYPLIFAILVREYFK